VIISAAPSSEEPQSFRNGVPQSFWNHQAHRKTMVTDNACPVSDGAGAVSDSTDRLTRSSSAVNQLP
jgi:hypothetical protein